MCVCVGRGSELGKGNLVGSSPGGHEAMANDGKWWQMCLHHLHHSVTPCCLAQFNGLNFNSCQTRACL